MIRILSHRGYWLQPDEKNTRTAFRRSFDLGFGTETDVRDYGSELVIAHDPPLGVDVTLHEVAQLAATANVPLALNVKADGLASGIRAVMAGFPAVDYFVFDMSVPDTRHQLAAGNPVYGRVSEVEPAPAWADRCAGVWLDAFDGLWYGADTVAALAARSAVCVVSPELHGRDHTAAWALLKSLPSGVAPRVSLCTDLPEAAREFFA